jgi:hypothetical protein
MPDGCIVIPLWSFVIIGLVIGIISGLVAFKNLSTDGRESSIFAISAVICACSLSTTIVISVPYMVVFITFIRSVLPCIVISV